MHKTVSRTLSFLLIPALLLPLLLSACMPGDAAETTPVPVTDITTPPAISTPEETTGPPETAPATTPRATDEHGAPATDPARPLYEDFVQNRIDPELKDEVYKLIRTTNWVIGGREPSFELLSEQFLRFKPLGKKAVPYILMHIEESENNGYFEMCSVIVANGLLGYKDGLKHGPWSDAVEYPSSTPKWYAQQLWREVFTP